MCYLAATQRAAGSRMAAALCPLRVGGREIKICSAPLSEQHSSAGLDAAAQRRKKGRKCLFRRFPGKPGRPGGKRLLGRRTSISGPATTERGSLRAHLAELVAGPSIAALYPPRVGLPCAILPRPRERQAAGWLLHCPLQSSQQLVVHGRRRGVSLILSSHKSILTDYQPDTTHLTDNGHRLSRLGLGRPRRRGSGSQVGGLELGLEVALPVLVHHPQRSTACRRRTRRC